MPKTLLRTKLFLPTLRPHLVLRPQLIDRLNQGLQLGHKLTLVSAPAGFGKTTLLSSWVAACARPVAWLSLDEGDNDPTRFLAYLVAALQTLDLSEIEGYTTNIGEEVLPVLQSPQPPSTESILTALINEISPIPDDFVLVLDDYHLIDSQAVDSAFIYLLENLPPQMHLVIATREDPDLPLARLRVRGQLTELRAADLRFTSAEAAEFLNQAMGLDLSTDDVVALETRTEGWAAGLQLAAISMQGRDDAASLIRSFTGSHRLVLDYLVEEVLNQQPQNIYNFLLQTAILDRLSGPLCNAVTGQENGQAILEILDRANVFIIPLDDERRWYRYHHLFADLLRQRLHQIAALSPGDAKRSVDKLHRRASDWYEDNGLEIEAFRHAAAASDFERAERLIEGDGLPLSFRGALAPVLNWLESLPKTVLDARPSLRVTYAMTLQATGQTAVVEEKLQAAEAALQDVELDDNTRDLIGRIADTRGTIAVGQRDVETIIAQAHCALQNLHPDNLTFRTSTTWKLGFAYEFQGDWVSARRAYSEAISISQASGNFYTNLLATTGLANIQLVENQLYLADETYRRVLQLVGDLPIPVACHVYLCLARISYKWNDLESAQRQGQRSLQLARPFIDFSYIFVDCKLFLARLKLAQGDVAGAGTILVEAEQSVIRHDLIYQMSEVASVQVLTLLRMGNLAAAADLAEKHDLPLSRARVYLAQANTSAALEVLEPLRRQVEGKGWQDKLLKVLLIQAVAHHALGEKETAVQLLSDALALAEPGGFIRTFVDEGPQIARLLFEVLSRGIATEYVRRLLAAFPDFEPRQSSPMQTQALDSGWFEPLSTRELDVLQLIAEGLTNQQIASRLYLALNTVKSHTRSIYSKLGVNNRTQAVARARVLGILTST